MLIQKKKLAGAVALIMLAIGADASANSATSISNAVSEKNGHRTAADRGRDEARQPEAVLNFFGVEPNMTVVENVPGSGWYSRILGPLLKEDGLYLAAQANPELFLSAVPADRQERFLNFVYGWQRSFPERNAELAGPGAKAFFYATDRSSPAHLADSSVDMVLDIRSIHNLVSGGPESTKLLLSEFYRVLKPGGVLGVVDHRENEGSSRTPEESGALGYVKESHMIKIAEEAGFVLAGRSEILANPEDTKDHEGGVWSLPPTFTLGDKDKEKYAAIGESDRMVMKFVKPEAN